MGNIFKCISCVKLDGDTQIKIKSSCFDKPIIISINSEDDKYIIVEELLSKVLEKKKLSRQNTINDNYDVNNNIINDEINDKLNNIII
jgi:hypothetical protein